MCNQNKAVYVFEKFKKIVDGDPFLVGKSEEYWYIGSQEQIVNQLRRQKGLN